MFLNNRHYDPTTGIFVSVDPLVAKTSQPYVYGGANPVRFSDPSGLCVNAGPVDCDQDPNEAEYNQRRLCESGAIKCPRPKPAPKPPGPKSSGSSFLGRLGEMVVGAGASVVGGVADRGSTWVQFEFERSVRSARNPRQGLWNLVSGTELVSQLSATEAILVEDGEIITAGECGEVMQCIGGVRSGKDAMVLGNVARFESLTPKLITIRHESQHAVDVDSVGAAVFYATYGLDWLTNGQSYDDIGWEGRAEYVESGGERKGYGDQITDWLWGWG